MSTLTLIALKIAFLILIWLFIFFISQVIRGDIFGRAVSAAELAGASAQANGTRTPEPKPKKKHKQKNDKHHATKITVLDGQAAGIWAPLPATGAVLIGRSTQATIDIADDYASSRHARVYDHNGVWVIEDLDSTNGTFINGQQISQPTIISTKDSIRIGRTHLALEV